MARRELTGPGSRRRFSTLLAALLMALALLAPAALPSATPVSARDKRDSGGKQPTLVEVKEPARDGKGGKAARGGRVAADPKIVGGAPVPAGTYRFMAFLHISIGGSTYLCGGSLIDPTHILTAAHCVEGASSNAVTAWIGGNQISSGVPQGAIQRSSTAVATHPSWNSDTMHYDVAVVTLGQAVPTATNGGVDPIPFAASGSATGLAQGSTLTVAGWGTTSSGGSMASQLMAVQVPVQTDQYCSGQYGGSFSASTMFCAGPTTGGKDSCQGDSGGPIFLNENGAFTQIGIVSWGYGCAAAGYPGIYSRVANSSINNFVNGVLGNPIPPTPDPVSDTTPPSVQITRPARNGLVRPVFTVSVTASDAGSGMRSVELQQCIGRRCVHVATDNAAPYSFRVRGYSGKAVIRVIATDAAGNTTTTAKYPLWVR